jgi:CubicO group peptidase (beta-lactamase class C family)
MKIFIKYLFVFLVSCVVLGFVSFFSVDQGWIHSAITNDKSTDAFEAAVRKKLTEEFVGNFAFAILENGEVSTTMFHSAGKPVDQNTIFQVASLSKFVSAIGIMKLVEDESINLDYPVESYLTRWKLPPSDFDNQQVTTRRLLSHTAGLTDGLGYSGFLSQDSVQTLESSLTQAKDADEGRSGAVKVGSEPGSGWKYSGGGFTLLQLLVEEVTRQRFNTYMVENIFQPLGMNNSSYQLDPSYQNLCEFYHEDGSKAPHFYYTSLAATSLYTSLADLITLTHLFTDRSKHSVLSQETLNAMREAHGRVLGEDMYGLGTILYTETDNEHVIIGHDGQSTPPINTALRLNPDTGDGIIILETGNPDLATRIASDWVFVQTGKVDTLLFTILSKKGVQLFLTGSLIIGIALVLHRVWKVRVYQKAKV